MATGEVDKTINVTANTLSGTTYLHFKGTIKGGESNDKIVTPRPDSKK